MFQLFCFFERSFFYTMDHNKKNKRPQNDNRNSKLRGIISLVCWALLLTSLFTYANSYMEQSAKAASSVELMYSEYQELVREGQVKSFFTSSATLLMTAF